MQTKIYSYNAIKNATIKGRLDILDWWNANYPKLIRNSDHQIYKSIAKITDPNQITTLLWWVKYINDNKMDKLKNIIELELIDEISRYGNLNFLKELQKLIFFNGGSILDYLSSY
jgi:hypothetical protein